VVVYPRSTEDVVKIVKIAIKYRMPVTAYSGATSLEGQFRGVSESTFVEYHNVWEPDFEKHKDGGICIDMSSMDKIIEIHGGS
jgi:D-lactate dehydrogenase (cytochrome)